jgi:ribosomal protein L40E
VAEVEAESTEAASRLCLACGARSGPGARFCTQCGRPLDTDEAPDTSSRTPPRIFGAVSADALFVAACVFGGFAVVTFLAGRWILAFPLLVLALALLVFFASVARDTGESTVARAVVRSVYRARGWAGLGGRALGAWSGAGRDVIRLRRESRSLRRERDRTRLELGDAAFREDADAVDRLRSRMHEIDSEILARERARTAAVAAARRRVEDERAGAQRTRQLSVEEPESRPVGRPEV